MKWLRDILASARTAHRPSITDPLPADNHQLEALRNYWRAEWEDTTGFSSAIDAGAMVLRCEREMKRRSMKI